MKKLIAGVFAVAVMTAGLVTVSGGTAANAADYPPAPAVDTVSVVSAPATVKAAKKKKKRTLTIIVGATAPKSVVGTVVVKITPNDGKGWTKTKVFPNLTTGNSIAWTSGTWPKKGTKKYKKYKGVYTIAVTFTLADPAVAKASSTASSFKFK